MNKTVNNAYFNIAMIHRLVSCVTFEPQHKVPPGREYGVSLIIQIVGIVAIIICYNLN